MSRRGCTKAAAQEGPPEGIRITGCPDLGYLRFFISLITGIVFLRELFLRSARIKILKRGYSLNNFKHVSRVRKN
jgi:hypothetical protein